MAVSPHEVLDTTCILYHKLDRLNGRCRSCQRPLAGLRRKRVGRCHDRMNLVEESSQGSGPLGFGDGIAAGDIVDIPRRLHEVVIGGAERAVSVASMANNTAASTAVTYLRRMPETASNNATVHVAMTDEDSWVVKAAAITAITQQDQNSFDNETASAPRRRCWPSRRAGPFRKAVGQFVTACLAHTAILTAVGKPRLPCSARW